MLEVKTYSIQELRKILGSETKKQIDGKLKRYAVEFESTGRGSNLTYTIEKLNDPFKVFCITELGFSAQADFNHLKHFLYHFYHDDVFMSMPDKRKELMMDTCYDYHISRQTIANYENKLAKKNYIAKSSEFIYYFAYKDYYRETNKEEYLEAWHYYWFLSDKYGRGFWPMLYVIQKYGGAPNKHARYESNAFYLKKIDYLLRIIGDSIEKEIENKENELE